MEKARLTREQAEALEHALKKYSNFDGIIYQHARFHSGAQKWSSPCERLEELTMDKLCRALYVGYEIIEEEQVITITAAMRKSITFHQTHYMLPEGRGLSLAYREGFNAALNLIGFKH